MTVLAVSARAHVEVVSAAGVLSSVQGPEVDG
jgi:hypothetical protein